jgi:hypothetical protein
VIIIKSLSASNSFYTEMLEAVRSLEAHANSKCMRINLRGKMWHLPEAEGNHNLLLQDNRERSKQSTPTLYFIL